MAKINLDILFDSGMMMSDLGTVGDLVLQGENGFRGILTVS